MEKKQDRKITDQAEHSLTTIYRRRLFNLFLAAVQDYKLVEKGDHICVCISGGKDSMLLAKCFMVYAGHMNKDIQVDYVVMNPGYNPANLALIKHNLEKLQIPAEIVDTDIFEIADQATHSACYLCARMRRGALYRIAKARGCNKIALGHHYDDVIDTTVMNMLNAGSFQTMLPKVHSDHFEGMSLIRPLYYVRERDIVCWQKANDLKFLRCACKFTERSEVDEDASKRAEAKRFIAKLEEIDPNYPQNIFNAANNVVMDKILGYKDYEGHHSFLDDYDDFVMPENRKK